MKIEQLGLDLFPTQDFQTILQQEKIDNLEIAFSKRLKNNWKIDFVDTKNRKLTLPEFLEDSPYKIKKALIDWAFLMKPGNNKQSSEYYDQKKKLENIVWGHVHQKGIPYQHKRIDNPAQYYSDTQGNVYNLSQVFTYLNDIYFEGKLRSYLRWGNFSSKTSYQAMHTDINGNSFSLITIAGVYNHPKVPEFAIQGVMYHEMLHILIPPYEKDGKTIYHGPEFRERERQFAHFEKWDQWTKRDIRPLLRSLKRRKKS